MVLVPEVVRDVAPVHVLAAGGIGTGAQIAAALALGAAGVWMGSMWLTSAEYQLEPKAPSGYSVVQEKLLRATSSDTVRSRVISGKPARMLRTPWTEAWEAKDSPGTMPMPLQGMLVAEAEARIRFHQNRELLGTPVGQIVGQMNAVESVGDGGGTARPRVRRGGRSGPSGARFVAADAESVAGAPRARGPGAASGPLAPRPRPPDRASVPRARSSTTS